MLQCKEAGDMIKRRLKIMDKFIELFFDCHNTPINGFRRGRGSGSSQGKERPGNGVKTVLMLCPPLVLRKEKGVVSKPFVFALKRPLEVNVKQLSNKVDRLCILFTRAARKALRLFVLYLPLSGGK